ncbi:MAG: hypothetical protein JXR81_10510 [Candidatus Goldbacteria bacterium]|nr:hypothetical protein [Candidatus Goldiibacteriota bacterium]
MRKNILFGLAFISAIAVLSSCGGKTPAEPKPAAEAEPCEIVIGNKIDDDNGYWSWNYLVALDQVVTSGTTVYKLGIKLKYDSDYILAIYDDNAGEPGVVLAQTAPQTGVIGWNEAAVTTPVLLSAGSKYWLVSITGFDSITDNTDSGIVKYKSYLYTTAASSGMPGSLTGWNDNSGRTKVYATSCR